MDVGRRIEGWPIPTDPETTRWVEMGMLRAGIEYQVLEHTVDEGVSLHLIDRETGSEYLRFDLLQNAPHYHYVHTDGYNMAVAHDMYASGDMLPWVVDRLHNRLRDMLCYSGATAFAERIDQAAVDEALPAVVETVKDVEREHRSA